MDIQKRKKQLESEFNQVIQQIAQLMALREELRGRWKELDKIEQEEKKEKK